MSTLQVNDLAEASGLDGSENLEIQLAAGGAGSSKRASVRGLRRRTVVDLGDVTGAVSIDLAAGDVFLMTLAGDVTLSWASLPASGTAAEISLSFVQDATGSHAVTFPGGTKWPGGNAYVPTSAAGAVDDVDARVMSGGGAHGIARKGLA